jgi:phosphopantetheinyl transferase (holo-ACP synthase)
MIGIDLTRFSRFKSMPPQRLDKIGKKFNTEFLTYKDAAKWWACHEAVIKCLGCAPDWKTTKITFPNNQSPAYLGNENIKLSISHEGDYIAAIAFLVPNKF